MSRTTTTDADGGVVTIAIEPLKATVQYSRKVGRENYGNEELGVFIPITLEDGTSETQLETELNAAIAFAKTVVLTNLGRDYVDTEGVITDTIDPEKPKAAAKTYPKRASGASGASKAAAAAPADKDGLWAELLENPGQYFDNREDKRNPKAPDFKRKSTGEGLWLDSKDTPESAKLAFGS